MKKLHVIKIGGNIINNPEILAEVLADVAQLSGLKILVHGGGRKASEVLQNMGIAPKMIDGRRITDKATLEVVTMVYAGLINKNIVAQLQALNCMAVGLTGADLNSIQAHKRLVKTIDFGFVGDVDEVNAEAIRALLEVDFTPVFSPITHDKQGQLLNTNADTIAAALAAGLSKYYEVTLRFCFEKVGVLLDVNDENSAIRLLDKAEYERCKAEKLIFDGMLPKIDNAFEALNKGVQNVFICSTKALKTGYFEGTQMAH